MSLRLESDFAARQPLEIGIVVIGRNEGDRLLACLESLSGSGVPVVYVDSGSRDGSVGRARRLCSDIVELDAHRPYSAARARNEGAAALRASHTAVELVQFLDGDCTLVEGWLAAAAAAMLSADSLAIVVGTLQERWPEASVYNRLCALEWKSPPGKIRNFGALGGIMLIRDSVFVDLGGFNEELIAGEDSELGIRAAQAGFEVVKIDTPMATHDAGIERFGQWWRRAVRGGHAIGQRYSLHGRAEIRDCARERRSVLVWGIALPATIVVLAPITHGMSLLLAGGYLVLRQRIVRYRLSQGDSPFEASLYARFVVIGKFAEAIGLFKFYVNSLTGRFRIIEHK